MIVHRNLHVDFRFAQHNFLTHVCNWDEYFPPAQIFFRNQRVWGYYQLVLKKGKYIKFVLYSGHKLPEWSTQWYLWQISSAPTQNFLRNPTEISWINFTVCGLWQTAPINSLAPSTMNGKDRPKYDGNQTYMQFFAFSLSSNVSKPTFMLFRRFLIITFRT